MQYQKNTVSLAGNNLEDVATHQGSSKMKGFFAVVLVSLLLVAGLVMVSCNSNCDNNGKCYYEGDVMNEDAKLSGAQCFSGEECLMKDFLAGKKEGKCDC